MVAPYASALAAHGGRPERALANLRTLERQGALGPYGFRDALDYTRPSPAADSRVVRTYMAHHVGMSLVALTNVLHGAASGSAASTPTRWCARPSCCCTSASRAGSCSQEPQTARGRRGAARPRARATRPCARSTRPTRRSRTSRCSGQLPYTIMVSHCGGGLQPLRGARGHALARRRHARRHRPVLLRAGPHQRTASGRRRTSRSCAPADWYDALSRAPTASRFHRADGDIETRTEIAVVPDDAAEVRRVTVTNNGERARARSSSPATARSCSRRPTRTAPIPAFANLFVETEWHDWCTAHHGHPAARARPTERPLLVRARRRRAGTERVGRGHLRDRPRALPRPRALDARSGRARRTGRRCRERPGAVLDPIFALRVRVRLEPRAVGVGGVHDARGRQPRARLRAGRPLPRPVRARSARSTSRGPRPRSSCASSASRRPTPRCSRSSPATCSTPTRRSAPPPRSWPRNRGSQPLLWAIGLSGDWPILLATHRSADGLPTLRQLLAAHHYWRRRGHDGRPRGPQRAAVARYLQELQRRASRAAMLASPATRARRPAGRRLRPAARPARPRSCDAARHGAGAHRVRRALARAHPGQGATPARSRARATTCSTPRRRARRTARRASTPSGSATRRRRCADRGVAAADAATRSRRAGRRPPEREGAHGSTTASAAHTRTATTRSRRRRPPAAGALGQRDRQPARRVPGHRAGRRLHLGREQLLLPAHARGTTTR